LFFYLYFKNFATVAKANQILRQNHRAHYIGAYKMRALFIHSLRTAWFRPQVPFVSLGTLSMRTYGLAQAAFKSFHTSGKAENLEGRVNHPKSGQDQIKKKRNGWPLEAPFMPYIPNEDSPDKEEWEQAILDAHKEAQNLPEIAPEDVDKMLLEMFK
jgi:hypothetical protein